MKCLLAFGILLASIGSTSLIGRQATPRAPTGHHKVVSPDSFDWQPVRPGTERAVVAGDPAKAGSPFVLRFRYHGNVRVPPHWHPVDEHITVLSGTFLLGMGERSDETSAS